MTDKHYTIKEAQIRLAQGAVLTLGVTSFAGVRQALEDAKAAGLEISAAAPITPGAESIPPPPPGPRVPAGDAPEDLIDSRAGLEPGKFAKLNLIGFKGDTPQLLRPSSLSVTDALVLLLFAIETGLKTPKIEYDRFKAIYEA